MGWSVFGRRKSSQVRLPAVATVVSVGSSLVQNRQNAISLRLRLRIDLQAGGGYEVTTALLIDHAKAVRVKPGATLPVDVVQGRPAEIHPRDGWARFDVIRVPSDIKVREFGS